MSPREQYSNGSHIIWSGVVSVRVSGVPAILALTCHWYYQDMYIVRINATTIVILVLWLYRCSLVLVFPNVDYFWLMSHDSHILSNRIDSWIDELRLEGYGQSKGFWESRMELTPSLYSCITSAAIISLSLRRALNVKVVTFSYEAID